MQLDESFYYKIQTINTIISQNQYEDNKIKSFVYFGHSSIKNHIALECVRHNISMASFSTQNLEIPSNKAFKTLGGVLNSFNISKDSDFIKSIISKNISYILIDAESSYIERDIFNIILGSLQKGSIVSILNYRCGGFDDDDYESNKSKLEPVKWGDWMSYGINMCTFKIK